MAIFNDFKVNYLLRQSSLKWLWDTYTLHTISQLQLQLQIRKLKESAQKKLYIKPYGNLMSPVVFNVAKIQITVL